MKKILYKKNKFNFLVLLFTSFVETLGMILLSLLLEKVLAIATSGTLEELYEQIVSAITE